MKKNDSQNHLILLLEKTKLVAGRDPQAAARGRSRYLMEASQLRETASETRNQRHIGWNPIFKKEMSTMKLLISSLVIILLLAGATTVFAAQDSLPSDALYAIKTMSEDVRLSLTPNQAHQLDRLLELARVRTMEMTTLVEQGENIPEKVTSRLHLHIENALKLAAGQPDQEMQASLLKIRAQLQIQEQVMTQLQTRASQPDQQALEQARVRTQEQLSYANQGLTDPVAFQNRYREQNSNAHGDPTPGLINKPTGSPSPNATGPGPNAQATPDAGYGPNSTPAPGYGPNPTQGSGYGPNTTPDPGYGPNPTQESGYGPNPTQEDGFGPNPTQGSGYGPNPTPGTGATPNPPPDGNKP